MDYALFYNTSSHIINLRMHSDRAYEFVKCVVVGDTAVGKTRLICSYVYNEPAKPLSSLCKRQHVPTVFAIDQYATDTRINKRARFPLNGINTQLRIWDTFGDHIKNRKFAYQNASVVVLCFNIAKASSLRNVNAQWYPEIKKYCPRAAILLVGTQSDLRQADDSALKHRVGITTLTDLLSRDLDGSGILQAPFIGQYGCVAPEAGRQTSREINALAYLECSVVTKYGVDEVFETAAFVSRRLSRPFFSSHLKRVAKPLVQKPFLPQKPKTPEIRVCERKLQQDFLSLFSDDSSHDITFMVDHELIHAHSVILLVSSPVFHVLLTHPKVLEGLGYEPLPYRNSVQLKLQRSRINGIIDDQVPQGFETIDLLSDPEENCKVFVKVHGIYGKDFRKVLEFLYSGNISKTKDIDGLLKGSNFLQMSVLSRYLSGIIECNPAMTIKAQREMFAHRNMMLKTMHKISSYADVAFLIENTVIEAHKYVLMANCSVMAGMFRNNSFKESIAHNVNFQDTNCESFLSVLEYLYTGNCQYYGDLHGTLQLANFLCLPRLVALCEEETARYITEMHERGEKEVFAAVLASYNVAQFHNAPQLSAWCIHFMTTNYNDLCKEQGKELKSLEPSTLKHLEEHRWPPVWYLKERDYYDRTMCQLEEEANMKKTKKRHVRCF